MRRGWGLGALNEWRRFTGGLPICGLWSSWSLCLSSPVFLACLALPLFFKLLSSAPILLTGVDCSWAVKICLSWGQRTSGAIGSEVGEWQWMSLWELNIGGGALQLVGWSVTCSSDPKCWGYRSMLPGCTVFYEKKTEECFFGLELG